MEMEGADFVVKTEGHCFLCRHQVSGSQSSQLKFESAEETILSASSTHSLQYLARYLKLDMKKVFNEEASIPEQLLDQLEKPILKVELCKDCADLHETFSKRYRQLEKSQVEVNCCLNLIHKKLVKAVGPDKSDKTKTDSEVGLMTSAEIAEALRTEALDKSTRKLATVFPRIKTQKLSRQQVRKEMLRVKLKSINVQQNLILKNESLATECWEPTNEEDPLLVDDMISNDDPDAGLLDQDQMDYSEAAALDIDPGSDIDITATLEVGEEAGPSHDSLSRLADDSSSLEEYKQAIPRPALTVSLKFGEFQSQFTVDSETGKYKCKHCTKEYTSYGGVQNHYNLVHLGGKYQCAACSQGFGKMSHYKTHYLNVHMAVRFKCDKCDRLFTRKAYLTKHQKAVHLG